MKVKIFYDTRNEVLEKSINDWFEKNKDVVVHYITQSKADVWAVAISIFYTEGVIC